jgi:hypothetical protein
MTSDDEIRAIRDDKQRVLDEHEQRETGNYRRARRSADRAIGRVRLKPSQGCDSQQFWADRGSIFVHK